jgi:hypothetical protein
MYSQLPDIYVKQEMETNEEDMGHFVLRCSSVEMEKLGLCYDCGESQAE